MIDISFKQHFLLLFTQFHLFFEHISKDNCSLDKICFNCDEKIKRFQVQSENSHSQMFQKSPVNFTENKMMDYRVY